MPAKTFKNKTTGRMHTIYSISLDNGNLLIPQLVKRKKKNSFHGWVEVEPGTSLHKRWHGVREKMPDPRLTEAYRLHVQKQAPEYLDQIMTMKGEQK